MPSLQKKCVNVWRSTLYVSKNVVYFIPTINRNDVALTTYILAVYSFILNDWNSVSIGLYEL